MRVEQGGGGERRLRLEQEAAEAALELPIAFTLGVVLWKIV
jgi:hypothetical protein